jgi:hypothetical protein
LHVSVLIVNNSHFHQSDKSQCKCGIYRGFLQMKVVMLTQKSNTTREKIYKGLHNSCDIL